MKQQDEPYAECDTVMAQHLRQSGELFNRSLLTHPSIKEAAKSAEGHAGDDFDKAYAGETEQLTQESDELDQRVGHSSQRILSLEKKESQTNASIKVSEMRGAGERKTIPFGHWDLKDQLVFPLALIFMFLVLGAGSANIFSAIMAQGQPIFLDNPILAIFLAFLLPGGSAAIHFLGDLLESDQSRHRYMLFILSLTAVALLAWTGLFAMNFPIGSDGLDLGSLEENSDPTSTAFTFVQLLAELLCGSSLFLVSAHIHSRYCSDSFIRTPESLDLAMQLGERLPVHEILKNKQSRVRGRLMQLRAMRGAHINEMVALYQSMRRRFEESAPTAH